MVVYVVEHQLLLLLMEQLFLVFIVKIYLLVMQFMMIFLNYGILKNCKACERVLNVWEEEVFKLRYTLKEEVKFQRHIIVPKNMKTLDYLLSDNVDEKILEEGEILSILSKNGMNIERSYWNNYA